MRGEIGEAAAYQQVDLLAARKLPGDVEPRIVGRVGGELLPGRRELLARHLGHPLGVLLEEPVEVACDEPLEEQDVAVGGDRAGITDRGVYLVAERRARFAVRSRHASVQFGARADPGGAGMGVDRLGVTVEDLAHLLAGERLHAALAEGAVHGVARLGREAELPADASDLVAADAAGTERLDERCLHRHDLLVGERDHVAPAPGDVVVHLVERGLARELHLSSVVLAGRNALELLEGDVDTGEVDGRHGGVLSMRNAECTVAVG